MSAFRLVLGSLCFSFALAGAVGACNDTSSDIVITPVTGIVIRSEALIGTYGCGTGPTQVYKYAAIVTEVGDAGRIPHANVFDCFADGVFVNLPASAFSAQAFTVDIKAFSKADYDAQNVVPDGGGERVVERAVREPDVDGGRVALLESLKGTYATECTATQQQNIVVLAVCEPLRPSGDAGISIRDASPDAESDGAADAATDAPSESGDPDADASGG